jgi:hypothetical protein
MRAQVASHFWPGRYDQEPTLPMPRRRVKDHFDVVRDERIVAPLTGGPGGSKRYDDVFDVCNSMSATRSSKSFFATLELISRTYTEFTGQAWAQELTDCKVELFELIRSKLACVRPYASPP